MNNGSAGQTACPMEQEELTPEYYVCCGYYWPEFFDKGAFVYSEVRFCRYKKKLGCLSADEAEKIAEEMNLHEACPLCGKKKFRAATNFDIINEQRIISGIINNAVNGR